MSVFGLIAMSSQDNACTSGCALSFSSRLFLCGRCRRQVVICRRCDRGQVYCGPDCALEVRRRNQRDARRRYQATDRGRRMHVDGGLNPRLFGAGSKSCRKIWRRRPWLRSFLPKPFISRLSNRWWHGGWAAHHSQGRQPPKAGAEGPPLQGSAAQPQSTPEV